MRAVTVVLAGLLAACAGSPPAPPTGPVLYAISAAGSEHSSLDADSTGERTGRGAARGAGVGAGSGALLSLICGPWALLCLGPFAGSGAIAGAVGGSLYGVTGLSRADARRVESVLVPLDQRRDFTKELVVGLRGRIPEAQRVESGVAAVEVKLKIERVELRQHAGDALDVVLQTGMRIDPPGKRGHRSLRYSERSGRHPLEAWLADDGALFDTELTGCVERTVQRMGDELARSATAR